MILWDFLYVEFISSANNSILLLLFLIWIPFISLFSLIALARLSSTILNRSSESRHPCLVPVFRRSTFNFSQNYVQELPFWSTFHNPELWINLKFQDQDYYKICCTWMSHAVHLQSYLFSFYSTQMIWGQTASFRVTDTQIFNTEPMLHNHNTWAFENVMLTFV